MSFSLLKPSAKKREQVMAIDLGNRSTKAVLLQRKDDHFCLVRYAILDTPSSEGKLSPQALGDHLKAVAAALEPKVKQVTVTIGPRDSILRTTELPLLPVDEMRQMLKLNPKTHLQQDLPDYVFDCYIVPPQGGIPKDGENKPAPDTKYKVWVGGIRRQALDDMVSAIKHAGLIPDQIALGLLGPANAFELTPMPKEAVALVDLGYRSSSISVIANGELCLNRVVETGGHDITNGLAEAMGICYSEAEGIKVGMPVEVDSSLQPLLNPLGRDLRASIDFYEHHQDQPVGQVFLSGGAARSEYFIQSLQTELMIPCRVWNPVAGLEVALPPAQVEQLPQAGPQLTVAIGAAAGVI
jgi:type IV pilus assembly protein PilM